MIGKDQLDPLVMQHVNQSLFEDMLKTYIQPSQQTVTCPEHQLPTLSSDEENIIRYAAGYVPMRLMKKYEKQSLNVAVEYVESVADLGGDPRDPWIPPFSEVYIQLQYKTPTS